MDGMASKHKESGIYVIQLPTLLSQNFLHQALKRNGFISVSTLWKVVGKDAKTEESSLMAKAFDNNLDPTKVSDPGNWYFTDILTQGAG